MSDPIANCTLELACTVGSIDNAIEALEDGADINHRGGAPLFNAIFNRNIEVIRMLIERGADLAFFIPPAKQVALKTVEDTIEMLMECAPPDPKAIDPGVMGETDATIRKSGLGKPILEGDWEGMVLYVEKLERIGAGELSACVAEVIEMLKPAQAFGDAALFEAVKGDKKKIAAITERYLAVENISVEEMARAFLDAENGVSADATEVVSEQTEAEDSSSVADDDRPEDVSAIAV